MHQRRCRDRPFLGMSDFKLPLGRPALMAILNVTPDSFSDGAQFRSVSEAVDAAKLMRDQGADLVDVGGESTRPGSQPVGLDAELERTIPVVEALSRLDIPVSIDTMKPEVASRALDAGAFMVNDVNGLRAEKMLEVCVGSQCHVCIMHMLGEPRTMQENPVYDDVVKDVRAFLMRQATKAEDSGLAAEKIWIDPGIGFGKTLEQNVTLLRQLETFAASGYPVVVGLSRKSMVGKLLGGAEVADRIEGSIAGAVVAMMRGARILRVHDVKATRRAIDVAAALI
ncbi:MAG: dihydropteroate synthase [Fimbriimonadaceae bacterium]